MGDNFMNQNNELLELAYAKLHELKMASISENDAATKFKLKRQIEELEKEIEELEKDNSNLSGLEKGDLKEDIKRLPKPSTNLVGRNEELEKLTMSLKDKNKNISYICAAGGIGKSALTFQWLKNMQPEYCNVEKVFAWSFYSQGSHDTQNSSTAFFEEALPFFGCPKEKIPKDDTAKGRLLVKYLNNQSFILILDGLEPLQHRVNILDGELKDVGISRVN